MAELFSENIRNAFQRELSTGGSIEGDESGLGMDLMLGCYPHLPPVMIVSAAYYGVLLTAGMKLQKLVDGGWLTRPKRTIVVSDSPPLADGLQKPPYVIFAEKTKDARVLQLALPPGRPGTFLGDLVGTAFGALDVGYGFSLAKRKHVDLPNTTLEIPTAWDEDVFAGLAAPSLFMAAYTLADAEWQTVTALAHRVHLAALNRLAKLARAATNAVKQAAAEKVEETQRRGLRALRTAERAERHALTSLLDLTGDPVARRLVETLCDQLASTEPLLPHIVKQKARSSRAA